MESLTGLERIRGSRVYLDANIFICFLAPSPTLGKVAGTLLAAAQSGEFTAVTGKAAIAEVMAGPYRANDQLMIRSTREFFRQPGLLDVVGHDEKIWDDTAMLRGTLGSAFIDALHVATAAATQCAHIVTNDDRMKPALGVDVVTLSEFR